MIKVKNVNFKYANSDKGAVKNLSLSIDKGECILLCGESGCGKTSLTRMINGLIPHYYEGDMSGNVLVNNLDVTKSELYEVAKYVGSVFQNPRSQFFCVDTTSEIAFGCENMGLDVEYINDRIKAVSEEMEITDLLGRNIFILSGGEKQKIACASVSAFEPDIFVLDEPSSNLDTDSIENLKKILIYWKSQGKTIIIAEHRLYWLKDICDRVIYMQEGEIKLDIPMKNFRTFPPDKTAQLGLRPLSLENLAFRRAFPEDEKTFILKNYYFSYDYNKVLSIPFLICPMNSIIAVIGHNGAGKSTFLRCLCGLEKNFKGKIYYDDKEYNRKTMLKKSYMVMQDVNHQLFCESVDDEVLLGADEEAQKYVSDVLSELNLSNLRERHPMSLSGGQKQRVSIASAILANKEFLIFDEPTSGLDFYHMQQTAQLISSLQSKKTIFIITHDPEFIIRCCTHVLHIEKGNVEEIYALTEENKNRFIDFFMSNSVLKELKSGQTEQ